MQNPQVCKAFSVQHSHSLLPPQKTVVYGDTSLTERRLFTQQAEYLIDSTQTLTLEQFLRASTSASVTAPLFRSFRQAVGNLGYQQVVVWVRFALHRSERLSATEPWIIDFINRFADSVTFHVTQGEHILSSDTAGFAVPFGRWSVPSTHIAFPLAPHSGDVVCYARFRIKGVFLIGISAFPRETFWNKEHETVREYWAFYGAVGFALLYNLLVFLIIRSRFYILYALYGICVVMSFAAVSGHIYPVLPSTPPALFGHLCMTVSILVGVANVTFVWSFVRERREIAVSKFWTAVFVVYLALSALALVAEFVGARVLTLLVFSYGYLFLGVPATLALTFSAWRKGYTPALFLFLTRIIAELAFVINILAGLNILPFGASWIGRMLYINPTIEMVLFAFALASRIITIQHEKREAERKALEGELYRLKNEELTAANEEILRQQTELVRQAQEIQLANTQMQELNVKLEGQNKELAEAVRDKDEFMGIAAHDLKNPLTGIRGLAETLQMYGHEMSATEQSSFLRSIVASSERMYELIKQLLDVNTLERGGLQLNLTSISLPSTLEFLLDSYRPRAEQKSITLHAEIMNVPLILADELAVQQVLDNLVSNAIKYSPTGKNVFVRCWSASSLTETEQETEQNVAVVRCSVRDEGPGLSDDDKSKLFGKFTRLTAQPTAGEHSTGLGLSIVKRLVEEMNGRVWCESELGSGATFIVEFPAA